MRKENIRDTQSLSDTESVISDVRSRGSSGSRVSFNPRVAIATHNYPSGSYTITCSEIISEVEQKARVTENFLILLV